jgi:hypothetical protein
MVSMFSRFLRAGSAVLLATGLLGAAISFVGAHKSRGTAAPQIQADAMNDLASRSPGLRTGGMLQLKKIRFQPVGPEKPHERVLSGIREHPPVAPDLLPAEPFDVLPQALSPLPYDSFWPGNGLLPMIGAPPGGGAGGGAGPVPELSTWVALIVGLFASGTAIRRRVAGRRAAGEGEYARP